MEENGKLVRFLFHKGEVLTEENRAGEVTTRFLRGHGIAAAEIRTPGEGEAKRYYYHLDERNSTALVTGEDQRVENRYAYDAFGEIVESREKVANRIKYTGQQYDQETGQYYLRARYYNPVAGRFLQEDVYRGDGLNLYAYCDNNPVMYYDPSGYAAAKLPVCDKDPGAKKDGDGADVKWTNHGYKHTPERNKPWIDIKKSTKSGPAKYHPEIKDIEAFERDAWETGKSTTNSKNWKTKEYDRVIGASEGKETAYVRIENSADTIHGHPITKQEYDKLNKKR